MQSFLEHTADIVWGNGTVLMILSAGILCTVKLRFIQFRLPLFLVRQIRSSEKNRSSIKKTICMSLGTAMGTGNITGVSTALIAGGPGAVLWMWVSAFLGMAVVFAENIISARYSTKHLKGPAAYLRYGLGSRLLSTIFMVCCAGAACGMGGMVQVNTAADSLRNIFPSSRYIISAVCFLLIFSVVSGGASRIGNAAQSLLPAASSFYAVLCIIVIIAHHEELPDTIRAIINNALGIRQAAGGFAGYSVSRAVSVGIRRGIFSNEAGLGSSPLLHSTADGTDGRTLGMWAMFEVLFDTFFCCTLTALALLCAAPDMSVDSAFSSVFGKLSQPMIAVLTAVFAFCTIIGWYYCFEVSVTSLTGSRYRKTMALFFSAAAASGSLFKMYPVWALSDIFNGLMALPNLAGIVLLIASTAREDQSTQTVTD